MFVHVHYMCTYMYVRHCYCLYHSIPILQPVYRVFVGGTITYKHIPNRSLCACHASIICCVHAYKCLHVIVYIFVHIYMYIHVYIHKHVHVISASLINYMYDTNDGITCVYMCIHVDFHMCIFL